MNLKLKYNWIHLTETFIYPEHWTGQVSRITNYKGLVSLTGDIFDIKHIDIGGLRLKYFKYSSLTGWAKANICDVQLEENTLRFTLPGVIEPIDFLLCDVHSETDGQKIECLVEDKPNGPPNSKAFDSRVTWSNGHAVLHISTDSTVYAYWVCQINGKWSKSPVLSSDSGMYDIPITMPYAECAYLEIQAGHAYVHRYYLIGKPGICSGRDVLYKGQIFEHKATRKTPWTSLIIPVYHPTDIDKVQRLERWNQVEWYLYNTSMLQESIDSIKSRYPTHKISILGEYGDTSADIQLLKPYQVNCNLLQTNVTYALCLFDDAADVEYARRSGWSMLKMADPSLKQFNFIDRIWQQGFLQQSNPECAVQYGYGFSFVRSEAHSTLWPKTVKDIEYREHKDTIECGECQMKATCRQVLPIPYNPDDNKKLPWIAPDFFRCPLKQLYG